MSEWVLWSQPAQTGLWSNTGVAKYQEATANQVEKKVTVSKAWGKRAVLDMAIQPKAVLESVVALVEHLFFLPKAIGDGCQTPTLAWTCC